MNKTTPVFVKIEEYKEILSIIDNVKDKIKDAKSTVLKLKELKEKEDNDIKDWEKNLDDVIGKFLDIDKSLFEPEYNTN
jgi:soluble cytochrome b562